MTKLLLFIKSYARDLDKCANLVNSIHKYNKDNLPILISVNDSDYEVFTKIFHDIKVIKDGDIVHSSVQDGWRYQQIIKSQVHRLGICENYLCLDSDSEFIKDFYLKDFMYDDHTPYTVMHESKDMLEFMDFIGMDSSQAFYKCALKPIRNLWGGHGKEWDFGPSPFIWSTRVWWYFEENYLKSNNLTFEKFLINLEIEGKTNPSEYMIYGEFLFKSKLMPIIPIQPLFKVYHWKEQYEFEKQFNTTEKLAKNYLGIIKQSNWN